MRRAPRPWPLVALALALALTPTRAHAAEPVGDRFARTLADLSPARVRDPVDHALALWQARELSTLVPGGPDALLAALDRLLAAPARLARVPFALAETQLARGQSLAETGRPDPAPFLAAGVPSHGLVLGPFPGPSPRDPPPRSDGAFIGKHGPTGWRPFSLGATAEIPLGDFLPSHGDAHARVGFAFEAEGELRVILGSNGPLVATLDGAPLVSFEGERALLDWQHDVAVRLAPGVHWLELAVGHRTDAPALRVRVIDSRQRPPRWLAPSAPPAPLAGWTAPPRATPGLPALARTPIRAAALGLHTESSAPSERHAARRIEALIAELTRTPRTPSGTLADLHYLLGRAEATDPSRAIAAFETADRLAGGHAQALAALIDLAEKAGLTARADELARRLAAFDPRHPAAIGHRILRRFQLGDALSALPLVPEDLPFNARLAALEATLAETAGELLRASRAYRRLAAARSGATEPTERAAMLALRASHPDEAVLALELALALHPHAADLHILNARARANHAESPEALARIVAELDRHRAFHHQSPHFEEMRGRLLLLAGRRGPAIEAFDRALELAPQNRELADYRRTLVAERGLAERWAEPAEALLARAADLPRASEGAITVFERTVTEVFDSGLSSQLRQMAVRIDRENTAERFEDMLFAFTPGEDRLEVLEAEVIRQGKSGEITRIRPQQVGEQTQRGKSEGVYTLTAFKVIRFPALEVGDLVHVVLRRDEIGSRNLFGDFFGVVHPMSAAYPKARAEAIIVAPATRPLYHRAARLPPPEVTRDATTQRLVFAVDDLPALAIEPSMPGYGDVGAWVSVSTFEGWQDLAAWYRELVQAQLEVPPDLARTARDLAAAAPDLEAKVAAIHRWVVTRTRYVGIEFGIHGFKPYKVAEVVQRGYGDCKDKAALLVAMLREVGIGAEFVLVRTRDLGRLDDTPATLWAFNHAIAYVPALDLYLDGTAESSGLRELPELDQGAQVLRLDLYSDRAPVLTQIPMQPPSDNLVVASARFVIDEDGDATADLVETVRGTSAGRLRARLQDATRRDALIAEIIAGQHPGTTLETASYENLDILGAPVTIRARVTLPRLAQRSDRILELPLVLEPGHRLLQLAPLATRTQPLMFTQTELEDNTDVYVLPPGTRLVEVPPPVEVVSPFGRWSMEVRQDGAEVVSKSRWQIDVTRIEPADYPAFRRFLEDVARTETQRLRFELPDPAR